MSQSANGSAVLWGLPTTRRAEVSLALWGIGSTRALRVHWMLAELGLPYISHRIQSRTGETMNSGLLEDQPASQDPIAAAWPAADDGERRNSSIPQRAV